LKRILTLLAATVLILLLCSCGNASEPPETIQTSATEETSSPETTLPTVSEPPETAAPTVTEAPQTEPVRNRDNDLLCVLDGGIPVVTEYGISQPLDAYFLEYYSGRITAFALIDMDRDGENELAVETDSPAYSYGVIHFEGDTAYVYPFGVRQLGRLKADGSFAGSNSAFNSLYMTMDFGNGAYTTSTLAECEYSEGWFTVEGKDATQEEFEEFSRNWEQRPSANWIYLAPAETEPTQAPVVPADSLPYLEKIPRPEQPIFQDPTYDSAYRGVVQLAGVYTIVEEQWDGEGNLWGRLKSGIGWVDLTDIRNPSCPLNVGFSDYALLENGFHYFALDRAEYPVSLVIRPDETVSGFRLTQVDLSAGEAIFTDTLFSVEVLSPDMPLVAQLEFPGDMSCFGIRFTDGTGVEHRYILSMSLRNSMPVIYPADY